MLTPDVAGEGEQPIFRARWQALVVAAALFGVLLVPVIFTHTWAVFEQLGAQPLQLAGPRELGIALMREYLLPFELASVLLLAALVGAIVIGLDAGVGRRVLTLAEELRARRAAPPAPEPAPEQSAEQP
jgi:NADH:ubiquinone oxidoreductase subunit 6 (subunit J)